MSLLNARPRLTLFTEEQRQQTHHYALRILAEAGVRRATRGLDVGDVPVRRPQHAQERLGMRGPRAHFHVVGLVDQAAVSGPEFRQLEDQVLECQGQPLKSRSTRADFGSRSRCHEMIARCTASSSRIDLGATRMSPT